MKTNILANSILLALVSIAFSLQSCRSWETAILREKTGSKLTQFRSYQCYVRPALVPKSFPYFYPSHLAVELMKQKLGAIGLQQDSAHPDITLVCRFFADSVHTTHGIRTVRFEPFDNSDICSPQEASLVWVQTKSVLTAETYTRQYFTGVFAVAVIDNATKTVIMELKAECPIHNGLPRELQLAIDKIFHSDM